MPVPKLYSVIPLNDADNPDIDSLTNLSSGLIDGSDSEQYAVLSYFPEKLKLSKVNDFVVNKYILFVLHEDLGFDYDCNWSCVLTQNDVDVTDQFIAERIPGSHNFEFSIALQYTEMSDTDDWEVTLTTTCDVLKNGAAEKTISLTQKLIPIEADLLSKNGASFEDETGLDNSAVYLGNEPTTHFMRGHLSEYLVKKKTDEATAAGNELNHVGAFVNQTAAIAYNNALSAIDEFGTVIGTESETITSEDLETNYGNPFNSIFSNSTIETILIDDLDFSETAIKEIGICDLHLHHVLPILREEPNTRVNGISNIQTAIQRVFDADRDSFIRAYHRCTFPKNAIELSVSVFDTLKTAYSIEAGDSNILYETYESSAADRKAKTAEWKELNYSELRDPGNDDFMKNLISEYYLGHYDSFTKFMIGQANPKRVLKIDWSQFIQKILNPSSVAVPFTLIKIQVNDLRSGKPIKHALIKKLEFLSTDPDFDETMVLSAFSKEMTYSYEIENPIDSEIPFGVSDSKVKRIQKICKAMGYYSGRFNGTYNQAIRNAMYEYLVNSDRELPTTIDLPESASEAHMKVKKDAWIDYIIQDFEANCLTDADGVLNCQVPDQLLQDRKLTVNVGFSDFAVIREALASEEASSMSNKPLLRPVSTDGTLKTGFVAEWDGSPGILTVNPNEQNTNWDDNLEDKNFGWKISNADDSRSDYLKIALPLEVKRTTSEDYNMLKIPLGTYFDYGYTKEDYSHFSHFHQDSEIHFVLYGMQWCQPIWSPIPASATRMIAGQIHPTTGLSPSVHVELSNEVRNLPKLVSTPTGSGSGRGRDYGTLFSRNAVAVDEEGVRFNRATNTDPAAVVSETFTGSPPRGAGSRHDGVDYFGVDGESPVFAPHAGKMNSVAGTQTAISASNGYGINRVLKYDKFYFRLAHLAGSLTRNAGNPDSNVSDVSNGDVVYAGTWLGYAGRTYYETGQNSAGQPKNRYYQGGATHLHFEVCCGSSTARLANPLWIFKNERFSDHKVNELVLLNNAKHRLFPCDSHWPALNSAGNQNTNNAARCAIRDNRGIAVGDRLSTKSTVCWASRNLHCPYMDANNVSGGVTPARTLALEIYRLQSQLTYLFEDDTNQGIPPANQYLDPGNIDGAWGVSCENAIQRFRELNINTIIPPPGVAPAAGDPWWTSQPTNGDDTWDAIHTEAPYPRINLNRVDK